MFKYTKKRKKHYLKSCINKLIATCIIIIVAYTGPASAQISSAAIQVHAFADRNIIPEGTAATVAIESAVTTNIALELSISGLPTSGPGAAELSVYSLNLSPQQPSTFFTVYVKENNEPQARQQTFTVEMTTTFTPQPRLPALTFIIPPNDLSASVSAPTELSLDNTADTVMIDIEPELQSNKSFIISSAARRLIVATGIITPSGYPFPIDVALNPDLLLGAAERLSLTIIHIDSWRPLTAQDQISAGISVGFARNHHSCAISTSNTVVCWGRNEHRQRELSSSLDANVNANTKFLAVDVGFDHTCGITVDNAAVCWGSNNNEQSDPLSSLQDVDASTRFLAVSAGFKYSCGIMVDGRLACWGDREASRSNPTGRGDANSKFLTVSAGGQHSCALRADSRAICWGNDNNNSTRPSSNPTVNNNTKFLAIGAGGFHSCGIKTDGRMACWGFNVSGSTEPTGNPDINADTKFLAVSVGSSHNCGIKVNGQAACWGNNNNNRSSPTSSPHDVDANTRFLAISAGDEHGCGIKSNGRVACWGSNDFDKSSPTSVGFQQASTTADVVYLAERSAVIANAGEIIGARGVVEVLHSQLLLTEGDTIMPTLFQATRGPIKPITITLTVAEANKAFLNIEPEQIVLTEDNKEGQPAITAVDNNDFVNIDPVTFMLSAEPREQVRLTPIETITVTIANNDIYSLWFTRRQVTLAEGESVSVLLNIDPPPTSTVAATFTITTAAVHPEEQLNINPPRVIFSPADTQHEVTIATVDDLFPEDTTRFTVGIVPPAGVVATVVNSLSVEVSADTDAPFVSAYAASDIVPEGSTAVVLVNAILRQSLELQLSAPQALMSTPTAITISPSQLSLSSINSSVHFEVYVEDNNEPQTNNETFVVALTAPSTPTQSSLSFVIPPNDLSAAVIAPAVFKITDTTQTVMISITPPLEDNKSFVVSSNDPRLIVTTGIITQAHSLLPIDLALSKDTRLSQPQQLDLTIHHIDTRHPLGRPTTQSQISSSAKHNCVIKADSTVSCWGHDGHGRSDPSAHPEVHANTQFLAISAAAEHSCAIATDNRVACWGNNANERSSPSSHSDVHANTKFLAISSGKEHSCGITVNNTMACWGSAKSNQSSPSSSLQGISTDTRFLAVSAGGAHNCAIKADNRVACWGDNSAGQSSPTAVPGVDSNTRFVAVSAGNEHSCAIKVDNTAVCWGLDDRHQSSPTTAHGVDANTRFLTISTGSKHSCGIRANHTVACWGDNDHDQSNPTSSPDVDDDTQFLAISTGREHSCGIKADGMVACWGNPKDGRTDLSSIGSQHVGTQADAVHLSEHHQIIPAAVELQEVIDVTVPQHEFMLSRNEITTLTLFTLSSTATESIAVDLQIEDPNEPPALNISRQQFILNPAPSYAITTTVNDTVDASTYIEPVRLILRITGDVRFPLTDTITVVIANPGLHKLRLATANITMAEGDTRTIALHIAPPPSKPITINLHNSSTDQITIDATVTFAPGTATTTATIGVPDDNDKEPEVIHTIRLAAAEADTRTYISTPELTVIVPADTDRGITIMVSPTSLELSPDDRASIHLAVPPRFAITGPITVAADTSDFITVTPTQLVLQSTNTTASMAVALTANTTAARAATIALTAISDSEDPQLSADNITVNIINLGINLKIKVYLEGALP